MSLPLGVEGVVSRNRPRRDVTDAVAPGVAPLRQVGRKAKFHTEPKRVVHRYPWL